VTHFPEGPATSPGFLLWRLTLAWQRAISAALAPLGLTHVQFVLLACTWWLAEQGQVPNQLELARLAGTDVKMTSQVVRKLETKALVRREVDPADTRARRLRLTAEGAALARRAITAVEDADAQFFAGERRTITPALQQLASRRGLIRTHS
jgi:DNA-binding MarR family transcriptional regulator